MRIYQVRCAWCGWEFFRNRRRINEARKFGWRPFCSLDCQSLSRTTGVERSCSNQECGKKFFRQQREIKKVRQSFCSRSCAAIIRNRERAAKHPLNLCAYSECNQRIRWNQKYCSNAHRAITRRIPDELQRKNLIHRLQSFYSAWKRIPVKREMYGAYKTARRIFGTWNKAVTAAGFTPNPMMFAERQIANDGHICDSLAEKVIDDWFCSKNIVHQRNVGYPNTKRLTVDFVVKGIWIEFYGLAGVIKDYDIILRRKRALAQRHKLPLIEIYPKDLFPKNRLAEILKI